MMNLRGLKSWLGVLLALLAFTLNLPAAPGQRDMVREQAIEAQLTALAPELVAPFREARVAFDREDYAAAEKALRVVVEQRPEFDAALRRLGATIERQGRAVEGRQWLERAVAANRSSANLSSLAYALGFPAAGKSSLAEQRQALALLLECRALPEGQDADVLLLTVQLALQTEQEEPGKRAFALLAAKYPEMMQTHYYGAVYAAMDERWIEAEKEIRRAGELGLDAATVQRFLDSGIGSRALAWRIGGWSVGVTLAWVVGLALLCGTGFLLSKMTLRQIERSDPLVPISEGERRLRRVYRVVLNVAGFYYYISLPVVLVLVVLLGGGVLLGFLMMGFLPIKLLLLAAIGVIATLWAMGRSLFLKVKTEEPGRELARAEAPGLWKLAEEVATELNTRPIDEIRITVGTDLCVYERGSWREKLDNRAKRVLVLGAAVLHGFKQEDFRSVLAHEYGHFANRDTAGGDVALRVQNDMMKFYYTMVEAGQATWLNVAFHFLRFYHFIFRRISHGATRLQEVLADRVAAQAYGPAAFEGGLRHVIRESVLFDARASSEVDEAVKTKRPLKCFYDASIFVPSLILEKNFDEMLNRPTTPDDTHPGPRDRFRLISTIVAKHRNARTGEVWDLFANKDALIAEMMATVEKNISAHR